MQLSIKGVVHASASDAWNVLAHDFATISEWFSVVDYSRAISKDEVGGKVQIDSNAPVVGRYTESKVIKATEVFTYFSESEMTFEFAAINLPAFVMSSTTNRTSVQDIATNKCEVEINVNIEFKHVFKILLAPIMKRRMISMFSKLFVELDGYLNLKPIK